MHAHARACEGRGERGRVPTVQVHSRLHARGEGVLDLVHRTRVHCDCDCDCDCLRFIEYKYRTRILR
eukprot:COSAG02_NODE_4718_length_5059_cov_6.717540_6_plen_67_part_00